MTAKEAIQRSLDVWVWMRDNNIPDKGMYPVFKDEHVKNDCYVCEYAEQMHLLDPHSLHYCNYCPVSAWHDQIDIRHTYVCERDEDSPWYAYIDSSPGSIEEEVKAIERMIELLENELKRFQD